MGGRPSIQRLDVGEPDPDGAGDRRPRPAGRSLPTRSLPSRWRDSWPSSPSSTTWSSTVTPARSGRTGQRSRCWHWTTPSSQQRRSSRGGCGRTVDVCWSSPAGCGRRGCGWWSRPMGSGGRWNGTCMTAPSSASSPPPSTSPRHAAFRRPRRTGRHILDSAVPSSTAPPRTARRQPWHVPRRAHPRRPRSCPARLAPDPRSPVTVTTDDLDPTSHRHRSRRLLLLRRSGAERHQARRPRRPRHASTSPASDPPSTSRSPTTATGFDPTVVHGRPRSHQHA